MNITGVFRMSAPNTSLFTPGHNIPRILRL